MTNANFTRITHVFLALIIVTTSGFAAEINKYYTTKGQDIIDTSTGKPAILRGFGIGCWLLPEGYMWGIRELNRPRHFEQAIDDLIGKEDAKEFWRLYHDNYTTEGDIKAMKLMGVNTIRIALLASQLQPRQDQPDKPPYNYSEYGFSYLDKVANWCEKYELGLIWDLHGAPGGQNAENISDSDGQARLWTEKEKYWPMCFELWEKIAERYKDKKCIVGYDLLNEPLLKRYGIDVKLLREFYVELTAKIREIDSHGIIFIEGDKWAQNFTMLEPLDWDKHLVVAFHSYPPTATQKDMQQWDDLRKKYNVPLWHGETGEQRAPYKHNRKSTEFLESANVGWSWWTHKKMSRITQPWHCPRTEGFQKVLDYWKGHGPRPSKHDAKQWLFGQARRTHYDRCEFQPDFIRSLAGLDVEKYLAAKEPVKPEILEQSKDAELEAPDSTSIFVRASGYPLNFQWTKNGKAINGENSSRLRIEKPSLEDNYAKYAVTVYNQLGTQTSKEVTLKVKPFSGPTIQKAKAAPKLDAILDDTWAVAESISVDNIIMGRKDSKEDLSASFRLLWDDDYLHVYVEVLDADKYTRGEPTAKNDSVEIYIDCDNSKSDNYGDDDFQFRYEWADKEVLVPTGKKIKGIKQTQSDTDKGYVMEIALPWQKLGGPAPAGRYIGIDLHVNDNDGKGREGKIAWKATSDSSYESPVFFGTAKLSD